MKTYPTKPSVKTWAEEDRPREKLLKKGRAACSDAELIAILIGSGSREENVVELSKRILRESQDNLIELSKLSIEKLSAYHGIGPAKALVITAALELGRRHRSSEALERKSVTCSGDIYEIMQRPMADLPHEEFWILLLNRANRPMRPLMISEGGFAGTVADPKKIFKKALENNASAIVLCHNHPSGNLKPSDNDLQLTRKLKQTGRDLDLPILDHLIIGENSYFSFADEGLL